MVAVNAKPDGISSDTEILFEWVDDDEWNAIERAFDTVTPGYSAGLLELPRGYSNTPPQMIASALSNSVPAPVALAGSPLRTASFTPQCGLPGQGPERGNPTDLNLCKAIPDGGEMRLGQNGFRARSPFPPRKFPTYCPVRSQSSDNLLPFDEHLPRTPAEPDASCSQGGSDTGSKLQAIFEFGSESEESPAELSGVEQAHFDGGKGGSAGKRKIRELPAWMQTTSPSEFSKDNSSSAAQMEGVSSPQDVMNTDIMTERFAAPADLEGRSVEEIGPGSALNQLDQQEQRLPWGIQPSSFVDNVKPRFPIMQFRGQIVYSKTESEVNKASIELYQRMQQLQEATAGDIPIGLDVEWRATFERGAIPSKVAVLQLCLEARRCDVMQIIYSGIPASLQRILEEPSLIKVGLNIQGDIARLVHDYQIVTSKAMDLNDVAHKKMRNMKQWSLASLAMKLTGKELQKIPSIRCGDWEAIPLSEAQLLYAAADAFASLHLYQILSSFPTPKAD